MEKHQLTVKELIELLSKEDPDAVVSVEGCDCVGSAKGVQKEPYGDEVCITRWP